LLKTRLKSDKIIKKICIDNATKLGLCKNMLKELLHKSKVNAELHLLLCSSLRKFFLGGITSTEADPRIIFIAALTTNAVSIMMAHNHPPGNLQPSRADEQLTAKFQHSGNSLKSN